jgi:hypothetical protein
MPTDDDREALKRRYRLTDAQLERWRELVHMPAASWPKTLQQRVRVAIEREGMRRDVIEWAVAAYVRAVVPKTM